MRNSFLISALRGTMFYTHIPFNWTIANKLLETLHGFIPVNYGSPTMDGNVVFNPGDWELRSPDLSVRLIFSAQKIDYLEVKQVSYSEDIVGLFAKKCSEIFETIVQFYGQPSTRLAIAPTVFYTTPFSQAKDILTSIYSENKMSFNGASLDNCEFSQVFRPTKTIADTEVSINFLSKFSSDLFLPLAGNTPNQFIRADFDINTTPIEGVFFSVDSIRDFFAKGPSFCSDFFKFYFNL